MAEQVVHNEQVKVDISQFKLEKVLGEGAYGKVFLVRKVLGKDSGTVYALKVQKKAALSERQRRRVKLERDILVDIAHPFTINLHYAFQSAERLYLVLKFCKGGDLFTRLNNEGKFSEDVTKFYLAELALALGHLHAKGIVYHDLKPENVLLDSDGHVVLTDFGVSELLSKDMQSFSFYGTVEYMAPEVIDENGHSYSADWWSFGILMFEMLTGNQPFNSSNQKMLMHKILKREVQMPTDLSLEANSLLKALLHKDPTKRIGAAPGGVENLKQHNFFGSIDFDDLLAKKIRPPFQPCVDGPDDAYFDPDYTSQTPEDIPAIPGSASVNEFFTGFSFTHPSFLENGTITEEPGTFLMQDQTTKRKVVSRWKRWKLKVFACASSPDIKPISNNM